jgi:hypothetical protein
MTRVSSGKIGLVVIATALTCGCANSGFDLSTASINSQQAAAAKSDPICASLASQINALKADGTIDKLEQAGEGKTTKVSVKRTALQKQAELNKAYGQFQTRCGPPIATQASTTPAMPAQQQAAAAPSN